MKNIALKRILTLSIAASLALSLAACSQTQTSEETDAEEAVEAEKAEADDEEEEASEAATEVVTYKIATEGAYAPYNYLDENGDPDGYDIAVAKAVDELIPEVEFEYEAVEWSSIFAGLEAERYDLIVSQAAKTEEREEKYIFGDVAYCWGVGAIAYQAGRTDIRSMDDLAGKTVTVAVGSSNANFIENWNEEHGNVINVTYGDGDVTKALLDVQEGRVDATLASPVTAGLIVEEQGLDVEFVLRNDESVSPVYWLYANTEKNETLKPLVDEALNTLLENGTLAALSIEYLGDDYSSEEAVNSRIGE
ncbi:MAG: transporter substrate-binding domain-containing protein [Lachnospiraceae bacterium]|nr:transporter substrate-binding domain-containing protein [Lachnospiraceae bacterium]